jgi:ElaB/YqjD/DUF883 family membrane-anchored ribosome-binding protein
MALSNSPLVTPLPRRDNGADPGSRDQDRLAELRDEIATLQQMIASMTANAAAEIERLGTQGAKSVRSNIEAQPWMSIGVAVAAGALLALAIVPRRSRGLNYTDAGTYNARDMADAVRRVAARGIDTQPITSRFERLVDSITSIDTKALTASPAYDTAKSWLQSLVNSVRK